MADEGSQAPSPPLPPDPAPAGLKLHTSQPPQVGGDGRAATPSTPSGRKRVDSLGSPMSNESPILQQRQPIKDALTSAANNVFEQSPVANQLDPDFIKQVIAQVTEQVIGKIAAGGTPTPTPSSQQTHFPPPPPPPPQQSSYEPRSPTQNSVDSGIARFTPPTPEGTRVLREERFSLSSSPEPTVSDAGSSFSRESYDSVRSGENYRSSETPKAFNEEIRSRIRRSSYANRRMSGAAAERDIPRSQAAGSDDTPRENSRRGSRDSELYDGAPSGRARPLRIPSDVEETPLEKTWQPLFKDGNPTERLSKFLRGLALHIIDDYEPKCSIVVSPDKMLQFLRETQIEDEKYPWEMIFGGRLSTASISEMYRKLQCQHHLTQDRYDRPPTMPSLTPFGFDWFMTCLIQAYPDSGFERMKKAVMHMPISNADDKSERFPKQLSRRLFPQAENIQAQQRLVASLNHEPEILARVKGAAPMPPPPPPPSAPPGAVQERERNPYSRTTASNVVDDDDLTGPSVPIERERKPYTAKGEGQGKTYGEDSRPPPTSYREAPQPSTRSSRTNSGLPTQAMYNDNAPSDPMNIPQRPHRMSASQASGTSQQSNGAYSKSARRASPPIRNTNARSDPDFARFDSKSQAFFGNPLQQQGRDQYPNDADEDTKRYRSRSRVERNGNAIDDDLRGYQGRGVPIANGYEYGSGVGGGPPIGQPGNGAAVGSYPTRRPTMGGSGGGGDERRRSMYNPSTAGYGDGGTDGYGSFVNSGYMPSQQSYGPSSQH